MIMTKKEKREYRDNNDETAADRPTGFLVYTVLYTTDFLFWCDVVSFWRVEPLFIRYVYLFNILFTWSIKNPLRPYSFIYRLYTWIITLQLENV